MERTGDGLVGQTGGTYRYEPSSPGWSGPGFGVVLTLVALLAIVAAPRHREH